MKPTKADICAIMAELGRKGARAQPIEAKRRGGLKLAAMFTPEERAAHGRLGGLAAAVKMTPEERKWRALKAVTERKRKNAT